MSKGSRQRQRQVSASTWDTNHGRTFPTKAPRSLQERERADANDYAEHGRRLRHSMKLHAPLDGTKFPDQTVTNE